MAPVMPRASAWASIPVIEAGLQVPSMSHPRLENNILTFLSSRPDTDGYLKVSVASMPLDMILMVTPLWVTDRVCSHTRPVTLFLFTRLKMPGPTLVTRHLSLIFHSDQASYCRIQMFENQDTPGLS